MELTVALAISILSIVVTVLNFALNRKDKAVKDTKEASKENHQELIEYQLRELKDDYKDIALDIKEIKKMLDTYKETFKSIVKEEMEEHIKIYHQKEKWYEHWGFREKDRKKC